MNISPHLLIDAVILSAALTITLVLRAKGNAARKEKGNKYKRSAELISAGLCHLIISCNEKETIEYIEESIKWLKEINVDQPCPSKNHLFKAN